MEFFLFVLFVIFVVIIILILGGYNASMNPSSTPPVYGPKHEDLDDNSLVHKAPPPMIHSTETLGMITMFLVP